jgi:hypothetical protein
MLVGGFLVVCLVVLMFTNIAAGMIGKSVKDNRDTSPSETKGDWEG